MENILASEQSSKDPKMNENSKILEKTDTASTNGSIFWSTFLTELNQINLVNYLQRVVADFVGALLFGLLQHTQDI